MYNYLLTISFMGSNYHGTQIQNNALTIQEVLQNTLFDILGCPTDIKLCSRLDSGVHAFQFCISFFADYIIDEHSFLERLNHSLPYDIRAYRLVPVSSDFHARYSSLGKRYEYLIYNGEYLPPFWEGRAFHIRGKLDFDTMEKAASLFIGKHDFTSFCSSKSDIQDKIREVYDISIKHEKNSDILILSIYADGFLYNMARIIAGAVVRCGASKLKLSDIQDYLKGKPRDNKLPTLPAYALYLKEVYY